MKSVKLVILLFYFHTVKCYEDKLVQNFKSILDDGNLSQSCQDSLEFYVENLKLGINSWALQMLDATSKIPVGILSLNLGEVGQFEQCLRTESDNGQIKAKYCLGTLSADITGTNLGQEDDSVTVQQRVLKIRETSRRISNLQTFDNNNNDTTSTISGFTWALCLPSNCTDEDVSEIFGTLLDSRNVRCQTKEDLSPPLTDGAIAAISVLAYFALLLVVSTALDLFYEYFMKTKPPYLILTAFSVYSNGKKIFKISKNSDELTCLNGMRFYSMLWVIAGHVFSSAADDPVLNFMAIIEWLNTLRSMTIVSGTLSVDTFFMLGGLLLVYGYFKAKYQEKNFNIFKFYIHRYLRLTPPLAAAVLVSANLLKYMGTGPNWSAISTVFEDPCIKNWWSTLLYIQNYATVNTGMCLPQTWYLSIDMQLFVLSPLILIPLWRFPKIGLGLLGVEIITFIIVPFCTAYDNKLGGLLSNIFNNSLNDYMQLYYIKTHTRPAPWLIGIVMGYILAKIKFQGEFKRVRIHKVIVVLLWMACIAVGLTCIYGGHSTLMTADYDVWANSFYIALVRPAWAVCLAWVVFACVNGYGGPINWFLSWPIYQLLNRFTYSMYLIHYPLIYLFSYSRKSGAYFSEINMAYSFWGVTMFTFGLSVLWVLAFESPVVIFEKMLFGGIQKNKTMVQPNVNKTGLPA